MCYCQLYYLWNDNISLGRTDIHDQLGTGHIKLVNDYFQLHIPQLLHPNLQVEIMNLSLLVPITLVFLILSIQCLLCDYYSF